jgi:hypothetical protein
MLQLSLENKQILNSAMFWRQEYAGSPKVLVSTVVWGHLCTDTELCLGIDLVGNEVESQRMMKTLLSLESSVSYTMKSTFFLKAQCYLTGKSY